MVDAVTFTRCEHTVSQRTADSCLQRNLPCPIGEPHPASEYCRNMITREIVRLFLKETSPESIRKQVTSLPIYLGDSGTEPSFCPVAEKAAGSTIGTIYSWAEGKQSSQWMGKVGLPTGLLQNDPRSYRTRTRKVMNLDTIKEKIACDCYTILGTGSFETPRTCLSRQPIIDEFTRPNILAQSYAPVQHSLRIMSRLVEKG